MLKGRSGTMPKEETKREEARKTRTGITAEHPNNPPPPKVTPAVKQFVGRAQVVPSQYIGGIGGPPGTCRM